MKQTFPHMKRFKSNVKTFLFITLLILLAASCNREKDKMCTDEFRLITINIKDSSGAAVLLDSNYTEILHTNSIIRIKTDSIFIKNGSYIVFTDSQMDLIEKDAETEIKFIGFKRSGKVVDERYIVTQDGCHIQRLSGNTKLTLKLSILQKSEVRSQNQILEY